MRKYRFFYTSAKGLLKSGYSDYFDVKANTFRLAFKKNIELSWMVWEIVMLLCGTISAMSLLEK